MAEVIQYPGQLRTMCILSGEPAFSFQGFIHNYFLVIKKVICFFSSVPHSLWGFGIVPEEYPFFSEYGFSGFMLCFCFHPALYFADFTSPTCVRAGGKPDIIFFPFLLVWF